MALALRPAMRPDAAGSFLQRAFASYRSPGAARAPLRFGVDLGTATIVLTAVDAADEPAYWDFVRCAAVRDGVVVDFAGAVRAVRELVQRATERLGAPIASAATAYPPGIAAAEARACRYVLESAGLTCRTLIDEVSAAHALVSIDNGALVDVGGGSTGVGVFRGGSLVSLSDAAGGGHHLDLIIAGARRIPIEEAEQLKRSAPAEVEHLVQPGIERIAESIKKQIGSTAVESVHLVGGALLLPHAAEIIARYLRLPTVAYPHADLITPYGMALADG